MKKLLSLIVVITSFFVLVEYSFAHVIVKPGEVGVAAFQTFTVGVPVEKDDPTVALRLVTPEGLMHVSPNVKPGWKIDMKKTGEGEKEKVVEISWTGGAIPVGQRDDFVFSAQVPDNETTLQWKAYQTYGDGSVVSWDQEPQENIADEDREKMEKEGKGPYSQTKVVNDLKPAGTNLTPSINETGNNTAMAIGLFALIMSGLALGMQFLKK